MTPLRCCLSMLILLGLPYAVLGQETDLESLQGTWKVVSGRLDVPRSEDPVVSIEISGDSVVARVGDDHHSEAYRNSQPFFKNFNESATPPQVDLWVNT